MSLPDRIESKIDRTGECHIWTGAKHTNGYGLVTFRTGKWLIHRLVWTLEVGPIPPGMTIDHVATRGCTSRACVRLDHLEVVTMRENILRGDGPAAENARKTHCPRGHPYDAALRSGPQRGRRRCKRCQAAATARWRARK